MNPEEEILSGLRILVVDDNADNRDLIEFLLKQCDAEVVTVSLATEALKILAEFKPDILITDISMPEKDGYWLINQIRIQETDLGKTIPVIALTGTAMDDISMTGAGFQFYLRKPIELDALVTAVAELAKYK